MASHMLLHLLFFMAILLGFCTAYKKDFVECMSNHSWKEDTKSSKYIYSPDSVSYLNLLQSAEHNLRWLNLSSLRPKFIVTPNMYDEIQASILCAMEQGLQIRVMSGGHDYEGLSYTSKGPFVLVDLINLRSIRIELQEETAWVQTGAALGELYYSIAEKSNVHGFPAGLYPSVGVGGHFSGGGLGTLLRKHGLAADNIIDAKLMNAQGEILDRKSMGEDVFWAIRGGGGASFGVILAWKIKLVRVPPLVTVFTVIKNLDREGVHLINKWQHIASTLPDDLFIRVILINTHGNTNQMHKKTTADAQFNSLFLGTANELLALMNASFPELGLRGTDCTEMSWINSTLYFSENKDEPLEVLLNRRVESTDDTSFKGKSDFVYEPLPVSAYQGINERLVQDGTTIMIMDPFGGKMDQIQESDLPFPHRKGNLFNIQYLVKWSGNDESKKHLDWMNEMYEFMEPYVSSSPRAAYLNYKDLDIGFNTHKNTSYSEAAVWGTKYFKGNFQRLAKVKKLVDPDNFFRDEQSIPPIS